MLTFYTLHQAVFMFRKQRFVVSHPAVSIKVWVRRKTDRFPWWTNFFYLSFQSFTFCVSLCLCLSAFHFIHHISFHSLYMLRHILHEENNTRKIEGKNGPSHSQHVLLARLCVSISGRKYSGDKIHLTREQHTICTHTLPFCIIDFSPYIFGCLLAVCCYQNCYSN